MGISIIIPARNEPYLNKTINDVLLKAKEDVEIIVVLEGYWPTDIITNDRIKYIHYTKPRGLRNAVNAAVAVSKYDFILKTDAHCLFAEGFDVILKRDCKKNEIIVPRRYRLDPEKWEIIQDGRPPVDYEYLALPITERGLYGVRWEEKAVERKDVMIDAIISAQGSCWATYKAWYEKIKLEDSFGKFYLEFQELSLKSYFAGGRVIVDKNTYYAHWHKTGGRGYSLDNDRQQSVDAIDELCRLNCDKFLALVKSFNMPGWKIE